MANLAAFLEQGGCWLRRQTARRMQLEGGLVRNVGRGSGITSPGVETGTKFIRHDHPVAYGYAETTLYCDSYFDHSTRAIIRPIPSGESDSEP